MSIIPIEETFKYVNQARTNPKSFAKFVQDDINSFVDNRRMPLLPNYYYSTNEGISAWKQCYAFLMNVSPKNPYKMSQAMNLVAKDHAIDMNLTGIQGHRGSDGSTLTDRIQRRCGDFDGGAWAQNIGSAFNLEGRNHALKTVLGLIIDDGVSSRGHRENIFSTDYQYIGIYSVLQGDKIKTVMNFHSDDLELADSDSQNEKQQPNIQNPHQNIVHPQPVRPQPQPVRPEPPIQPQQQIDFPHSQFFNNQETWKWGSNQQGWADNFNWTQEPPKNIYNDFQQNFQQQQGYPGKKRPKKSKKVKIGSSMRQSTEYVNGKTIVRTTQTIRYSDGSVEEHETIEER